jgi:hypothetical protein
MRRVPVLQLLLRAAVRGVPRMLLLLQLMRCCVRVGQRAVVQPQDVVALVEVPVREGGLPLHLQQEHRIRLKHLNRVRTQGQ